MKNKEKMYLVKKYDQEKYSMIGFDMWSTKGCARLYTLEQAKKLINAMPPAMGNGVLVEVV